MLISAALSSPVRGEVANRIVATIDGEPVTAFEVRRYGKERGAGELAEHEVLEALITEKILEKEIKAHGIAARDDEIDRYVDEIRTRNRMNEEQFRDALSKQGFTMEAYRKKVKTEIEKGQLVNREIRQRVNVSPEEIRRHYQTHLDDYEVAERVTVQGILFTLDPAADEVEVSRVRARAEHVRALAAQGRDFGDLAREFSEGPGADKGGELGTFAQGEMERPLEDVVFRLKPGQVSEPVRTRGGVYLLRVGDRVAAGHRPLEKVEDEIRESLYNEALEARFKSWLTQDLRERHHVEVLN
jgi:peptidyl-prolyl cis-trans isomerase SurA